MSRTIFLLWVDEAGRGSWAGPVVAGACALCKWTIYSFSPLLDDSKKLSPKKREKVFSMIQESIQKKECFGAIGVMSSEIIDQVGIREANRLAMEEAMRQVIEQIGDSFESIKIDGRDNYKFENLYPQITDSSRMWKNDDIRAKSEHWSEAYDVMYDEQGAESLNTNIEVVSHSIEYIVRGDSFVPEIQAASILAKVGRDHLMENLAKTHPNYGFEQHKWYGTRLHEELLEKHRPSEVHRKTYAPIKKLISEG